VRVEVERELASTETELEKYRGISANLDSLLNDANGRIAEQEKKIRKLIANEKDANRLNKKLKAELEAFKKLKDEYLEKIDQLIIENNALKAKNEELNNTVSNLSEEKKNLQGKVATASQIKVEYLKINAYKKKNSGKYVEATIAKRTNKIEACFTVMDNKIAEHGDKNIYMVIKEPGGKILAGISRANFTDVSGNNIEATASYKIHYEGDKIPVCINFENEQRILVSGNYAVEIYMENTPVASGTLMLK
jgi:DNA repair exonuclease SbcCD ATPase subunit